MASSESNLKQLLEDNMPSGEFKPYVEHSKEADALTFVFKPDADYSKRLTDHVTLHISLDTGDIVGCRIKGMSGLLEDLPNFIHVNHEGVRLSFVFWSFCGGTNEHVRNALRELAQAAGDMTLQPA
jgi:hypothetical protein